MTALKSSAKTARLHAESTEGAETTGKTTLEAGGNVMGGEQSRLAASENSASMS